MTLAGATKELASRYDLGEDVNGVVVTKVEKESSAAEKGLRPGDVITEINQIKVKTVKGVVQQVKKATKAGRKSVLLLVNQGGDLRFLALRMNAK
jgi:serine protease Do